MKEFYVRHMRLQEKYASILYLVLLFSSLLLTEGVRAQHSHMLDGKLVSVTMKRQPLSVILDTLQAKTGVLLNSSFDGKEIYSIDVRNKSLRFALEKLFRKKQLKLQELEHLNMVKVQPRDATDKMDKNPETDKASPADVPVTVLHYRITGQVIDEEGMPLPGATIQVKGKKEGAGSDTAGNFSFLSTETKPHILITFMGYEGQERQLQSGQKEVIILRQANNSLDGVTVVGYMDNSNRYSSGSVSKVTAKEIEGRPTGNPLLSLQGRIPGMVITQSSGVTGAAIKVNLRGINSLFNGSDPLYIVNGTQLPGYGEQINQLPSVASQSEEGGISPFTIFGLYDIESIYILKDAVATAAYGSRGANGVVIINTKKGEKGKLKVTLDYMYGVNSVSHKLSLLNTQQYISMRKEAFRNDTIDPSNVPGAPGYAPDLTLWDTTRYTDWQKMLRGRLAGMNDLNISISGGTKYTRLLLSTGIYREGTVYSKDMSYLRSTINLAADHQSKDARFKLGVYANYSVDNNQLFSPASSGEMLPPNAPKPYDAHHNLVWQEGGESFANPMAERLKRYSMVKNNLIVNVTPSYEILPDLRLKANIGLTGVNVYENSLLPIASQNPYTDSTVTGSSSFATGKYKSLMFDPVLEFAKHIKQGDFTLLGGYSFQYATSNISSVTGYGYTDDMYLRFLDKAPLKNVNFTPESSQYRYGAFFTQFNYKYNQKYILDMTFRRDGSSKFSPERRFGNFWAFGVAWIFSKEKFFQPLSSFVRYGKLRSSIGVTGNDKIENYKYLDTWSPVSGGPYQGTSGLRPDALYNPAYSWETCRKIEFGLDIEFTPADMYASLVYFTNRSSNQLVRYNLPSQTGFSDILKNIDAAIRNSGWEFTFDATIVKSGDFKLFTGVNLTVPKSRLLRFEKLSTSAYYGSYVVGESVKVLNKLHVAGVDPKTGLFIIEDKDGASGYSVNDYQVIGHLDPSWFGGFRLGVSWKALELSLLGDFRKQMAPNYLYATYIRNALPGTPVNQAVEVLDRWGQYGDNAIYPRFSTMSGGDVYSDRPRIINSDRAYSDASFMKLRNVYVYYTLPPRLFTRMKLENIRVYCKAQNLFTITRYQAGDPETASPFALPPLRTVTMGVRASF